MNSNIDNIKIQKNDSLVNLDDFARLESIKRFYEHLNRISKNNVKDSILYREDNDVIFNTKSLDKNYLNYLKSKN